MKESIVMIVLSELYQPILMYLVIIFIPLIVIVLSKALEAKQRVSISFITSITIYVILTLLEAKFGIISSSLMSLPNYNNAEIEMLYYQASLTISTVFFITPIIMLIAALFLASKYRVNLSLSVCLGLLMNAAGLYSIYILSRSEDMA